MKNKKKITSDPKLLYSAPILSLHCTLMSISIPGVGLGDIPCVAAVRIVAKATLQPVSDRAGRRPQLSPSLHSPPRLQTSTSLANLLPSPVNQVCLCPVGFL